MFLHWKKCKLTILIIKFQSVDYYLLLSSPSDDSRVSNPFEAKDKMSSCNDESGAISSTISSSSTSSFVTSSQKSSDDNLDISPIVANEVKVTVKKELSTVPYGVIDFDKENWNDPYQVSCYTMDIFNYLKARECKYKITDYIGNQPELSKWMRFVLHLNTFRTSYKYANFQIIAY